MIEALKREDVLEDAKLQQELLLNQALSRENSLQEKQLIEEQKLTEALKRQQQLTAIQQQNERMIRWLLMALVVAALAIGLVYFIYYNKQRNANKIIAQQKDVLQTLLKEMHHRTKNNLQIMLSIMRMQKRNINDEELLDVLGHSENRLQSMALIHEKLYQTNEAGVVSVKDYLAQLALVISEQLSYDKHVEVAVIDQTNGLLLDLDMTISLGLIVNELITNAIKYAFEDVAYPSIQIQISQSTVARKYQLLLSDNGIGFSEEQMKANKHSIGLKLVRLIAEQIGGGVFFKPVDKGASIIVEFTV